MAIPYERIEAYRAQTFCLSPGLQVKTKEEAVDYVNQRGFVYFWPIAGVVLPSLWVAVAGNRPVADEHDDPGHITWGWKDSMLGGRSWYYAKILRKRATMLAWEIAPYFYALSENYGAYEEDYLTLYEQGRLTMEARQVYQALLDKGPLDTIELRRATRMSSPASEGRFNKALLDLQSDFKILPVGVTQSGAWHYAFAYEIVARHYPELPEQAHEIGEAQARQRLAEVYLRSVGAARPADLSKLFGWRPPETGRVVDALAKSDVLRRGVEMETQPGEWLILSELAGL
jgi:hypothetical protein